MGVSLELLCEDEGDLHAGTRLLGEGRGAQRGFMGGPLRGHLARHIVVATERVPVPARVSLAEILTKLAASSVSQSPTRRDGSPS